MSTEHAPESAVDFDRIRAALVAPLAVRPKGDACQAMHFASEDIGKLVVEWCKQSGCYSGHHGHVDGRVFTIGVKTGPHRGRTAHPGDWIVRDHWGHHDVLTAGEFEDSYEPA